MEPLETCLILSNDSIPSAIQGLTKPVTLAARQSRGRVRRESGANSKLFCRVSVLGMLDLTCASQIIGVDISDHMAPTIYEDTFPNVYLLVDNLNLQCVLLFSLLRLC